MPLTSKGQKIMKNMIQTYGDKDKAEEVFYASRNKGTINGVESAEEKLREAGRGLKRAKRRGRG